MKGQQRAKDTGGVGQRLAAPAGTDTAEAAAAGEAKTHPCRRLVAFRVVEERSALLRSLPPWLGELWQGDCGLSVRSLPFRRV